MQTIIAQRSQAGILQGLAAPVPSGAASLLVQLVASDVDLIAVGIDMDLAALASFDHGATWKVAAGIPGWRSGPLLAPPPPGVDTVSAPGVFVPVWAGATHCSGSLNLRVASNVGLALTYLDASGNIL